jgi:hypothetical protein
MIVQWLTGCSLVTAKMRHLIHYGHLITIAPHNENEVWRAHAIIDWDKGKFDLHDEVCFSTEIEAEEHAVELAKHWVNNHRQKMQG